MKSWDSVAGHESSQASLLVGVSLHLTIFSFLAARISPCILASGNAVGRDSQLVTKPLCPEPIVGDLRWGGIWDTMLPRFQGATTHLASC
jgi:hypothetical protein